MFKELKPLLAFTVFLLLKTSFAFCQPSQSQIDGCMNLYSKYSKYSGVVQIVENNKTVYKKAFGLANRELNISNRTDTKYRIASMTKSFTSVLTFQFIEKGKLNLTDKVSSVLTEYPKEKGDKITINHLLTHTAGLRDITDFPRSGNNFSPITAKINAGFADLEEITKYIGEYNFLFEPGTGFRYSNDGYILLGRILEKIAGKPYETVLKENILDVLNMQNTGMAYPKYIIKNKANGYDQTFYGYENASLVSVTSAGGMYSTTEDLNKFSVALLNNKLITDESKKIMFSLSPNVVAYGWKVRKVKDETTGAEKTIIMNDGSIPGYTSFMVREVESNRLFIFLTNTREMTHKIVDVYFSLSNILNGKSYQKPKQSGAEKLFKLVAENKKIEPVLQQFEKIQKDTAYYINENEINSAGYQFLNEKKITEAITIFKLNTIIFPKSANAFDSLGEVYLASGDNKNAIFNYEKSLELNPKNTNAADILKKLKQN